MMERVSNTVAGIDPAVRFGISPFGIYQPGTPAGIVGLNQYEELYADPVLWKANGWVDYLAPQLYWPTTQTQQAFSPLLDYWSALPETGRSTFTGQALYQLGSNGTWTVDEFRQQLALTRARRGDHANGCIYYHIGALAENRNGIRDVFRDEFFAEPALTPPVFDQAAVAVDPPAMTLLPQGVGLSHPSARWWVVYAEAGAGWRLDRVVSSLEPVVELPSGRWAISAAGKHGVESLGVVAVVP